MKSSRSPSSTACVLPISTLVRKSLMRDWSSTYERIWCPQPISVLVSSIACFSSLRLRNSELVEARFQHGHRFGAVAVLRAVALALHDDAGGNVRDANRRVGFVDVLAARAGCAKGIDAQIRRVDVDLDGVIDLGIDKHAGKRGMAAVAGIERRFAHQPVHAGFGAQIAVGIIAG